MVKVHNKTIKDSPKNMRANFLITKNNFKKKIKILLLIHIQNKCSKIMEKTKITIINFKTIQKLLTKCVKIYYRMEYANEEIFVSLLTRNLKIHALFISKITVNTKRVNAGLHIQKVNKDLQI